MKVLFLLESAPAFNGRYLKMMKSVEEAGGKVHAIWPRSPSMLRHLGKVGRAVDWRTTQRDVFARAKAIEPDIVHVMHYSMLRTGASLRHQSGAALVYDMAEAWEATPHADAPTAAYVRRTEARWGVCADAALTVSDGLARLWRQKAPGAPAADLVRNAVAVPSPITYDGRLHRAAKVSPETRIVLYQGGFGRGRGLLELAGQADRLPDSWRLVLMGSGELEPALKAEAARSNARPSIILKPAPFDTLEHWTAGATAGLIPYQGYWDNHRFCLPNKLFEFAASSVPVVAADDLLEVAAMVRSETMGWVSPAPLALDQAFGPHGPDNAELDAKRAAARRFALANDWSHEAATLLSAYEKALARRSGGAS